MAANPEIQRLVNRGTITRWLALIALTLTCLGNVTLFTVGYSYHQDIQHQIHQNRKAIAIINDERRVRAINSANSLLFLCEDLKQKDYKVDQENLKNIDNNIKLLGLKITPENRRALIKLTEIQAKRDNPLNCHSELDFVKQTERRYHIVIVGKPGVGQK